MADHLGYRKKLGTLGPSTNTIVQPDFDDLRPAGVTNHYSRIAIPNDPVTDDASFLRLVENINLATLDAVDIFYRSIWPWLTSCQSQDSRRRQLGCGIGHIDVLDQA